MLRNLFLAAVCASFGLPTTVFAQNAERCVIKIGDSVAAAVGALRKSKIECTDGGREGTRTAANANDYASLSCVIDKHRTWVEFSYSKSTGTITGITALTIPYQQAGKLYHVWSDAKSVTIYDDGSYSI